MRVLLALFIILFPYPAYSFDRIFAEPCAKAGISKELAIAIARQESNLHPWCINVQGKDFIPKTYHEACGIIHRAHKAGKSYDVGLMQINCEWTKRWKMNPLDLLDPVTNIRLGLKILKNEIKKHGLNWLAVGKYHSPKKERGRRYAWKVYRRMNGNEKAMLAARETKTKHIESLPYREGIFRSSGIKPKGRLITFGIRKENMSGEPDTQQGGSTGTAGTSKN